MFPVPKVNVISGMVVSLNYLAQARTLVGDFLFYFDVAVSVGYCQSPNFSKHLTRSMGLRPQNVPLTA